MRPMSEFRDQLFLSCGAAPGRLHEFSCGHVVSGYDQLMPVALAAGPTGRTLDFTFQARRDAAVVRETTEDLGAAIERYI